MTTFEELNNQQRAKAKRIMKENCNSQYQVDQRANGARRALEIYETEAKKVADAAK